MRCREEEEEEKEVQGGTVGEDVSDVPMLRAAKC